MKLALACPEGTVTVIGTDAVDVALLARLTTAPALPAGPLSVTVAVELFPPANEGGFKAIPTSVNGTSESVADWLVLPKEPVMVTGRVSETVLVVTVKVAEVAPAATIIELGAAASGLDEVSDIVVPLLGAGPLSVTVPVAF